VDDDLKALTEIYRVLKPGGHAILQTPYSAKLHHTWEDPGIDDDAARLQAYGQIDHVRLFGRDIFARFASTGLASCVRQHHELLPDVNAAVFGVNPREPLFLFRRPD
jgi:SAM-dependent methyltransferase